MDARKLFAAATAVPFPIEASFSGIAEISGRAYPFVAGVNSRYISEETVGFYDPLGGPVLFIVNDGKRLAVFRGAAAGEFPVPDIPAMTTEDISLGRILSGAPGYPIEGGDPGRTGAGEWVLADGRQKLFSDPARRFLARAEYSLRGTHAKVSYPGRETAGTPPAVAIEIDGAKVMMRRDKE